jgi:hypothetical protein
MKNYDSIGVQVPQVLLPRPGIDLKKWAVIACDQYTSQPDYWDNVKQVVGDAPSTFNLILPEVCLGKPEEHSRIRTIQQAMRAYLDNGVLVPHNGLIYVERCVDGKTRRGLMLCIDLEKYDFNKGSQTLIRATEGTILERLPPRIRIRQGAPLEVPHILVLIDDPDRTVLEPIAAAKPSLPRLYDFDLMVDSGHLSGWSITNPVVEKNAIQALQALADPFAFQQKYQVGPDKSVLLFAVGDGNHSLATAKSIWEQIKLRLGADISPTLANHPARYALVEIENVHDAGLGFEPIHRVLFGVKTDLGAALQQFYPGQVTVQSCTDHASLKAQVDHPQPGKQAFGLVTPAGDWIVEVSNPPSNLPVGTLQTFLDSYLKAGEASSIDYIHGAQVIFDLAQQPGQVAFYLPAMPKSDLFKTVILDGALPRKTFSMGEAHQKRFYLESRLIT